METDPHVRIASESLAPGVLPAEGCTPTAPQPLPTTPPPARAAMLASRARHAPSRRHVGDSSGRGSVAVAWVREPNFT